MGKHKVKIINPTTTTCPYCGRSIPHAKGAVVQAFCNVCLARFLDDEIDLGLIAEIRATKI